MTRSRKYNLISQKFISKYEDIPLIRQNNKTDKKCNVSVEVFDTDYLKFFFETFDVYNLYAIFILDSAVVFPDPDFSHVSKYNRWNKNIVIAKIDFNFFKDINYNSRREIEKPFFFRSDSFEELNINEILNECLYERELVMGDFRKNIVTVDPLQLLNNKLIKAFSEFYVDRTEAFIEKVLHLKDYILDENRDYISKIEISLIND
ncbi:hypothetical protein [Flavobacterium reichenbachii]|uniref:Uncharacterized protein n=1 Tax=Flavobacterium reichenbachii TaxID=362418 RepID=A0A085ZDW1_9FLAO|nr:hypothetical protein [Flavobacterium reichenbachii]KFF02625.1 hypothetical protein IW19_23450 [Flavobacterium reichenbachii]OXB11122.1 hypothetical protein B0A68_21085 [Flavobacterium reichenbachii]